MHGNRACPRERATNPGANTTTRITRRVEDHARPRQITGTHDLHQHLDTAPPLQECRLAWRAGRLGIGVLRGLTVVCRTARRRSPERTRAGNEYWGGGYSGRV